ncbi:MAG: hypothetical protein AB8F95_21445 [Bacteroidia bacterium]
MKNYFIILFYPMLLFFGLLGINLLDPSMAVQRVLDFLYFPVIVLGAYRALVFPKTEPAKPYTVLTLGGVVLFFSVFQFNSQIELGSSLVVQLLLTFSIVITGWGYFMRLKKLPPSTLSKKAQSLQRLKRRSLFLMLGSAFITGINRIVNNISPSISTGDLGQVDATFNFSIIIFWGVFAGLLGVIGFYYAEAIVRYSTYDKDLLNKIDEIGIQ